MSEETKNPMKHFKAPDDLAATQGLWLGGAWFPFKAGILALPDDGGTHEALLPPGFVRVAGPQVPGAEAPAVLEQPVAPKDQPKAGKRAGGDSGEPTAAS